MRRLLSVLSLAAGVLAATAVPALAHPTSALDPTLPTDLTFAATDNVEHLGRFPEHTGTAGGFPSEDGTRFYLTDPRGVYVYDTTTPESPRLLGSIALFQTTTGAALAQEDPDTNGEILLVDAALEPYSRSSQLRVVDVSDPANLAVLSSVDATDHTWTCVTGIDAEGEENACAFAYGRSGDIVDLTDPSNAALAPQKWRASVGLGPHSSSGDYAHDLTEIRPGLVMSAGADAVLMDTTNPLAPVRLAAIERKGDWSTFGYHSVEWAQAGGDRYLIAGTELAPAGRTNAAGSDCESEQSVIETWDASEIVRALHAYDGGASRDVFRGAEFRKVDAYDAGGRGIFLTGNAPGHVLYCAHWMEPHPDFDDGGLVAVSYYDRGTRFVRVASDGTMGEVGWIVPAEGYSGSPQWISDDVVYIMDYRRGLEVVRFTDEPATGVQRNVGDVVAPASVHRIPVGLDVQEASTALGGLFSLVVVGLEVRRRRALAA